MAKRIIQIRYYGPNDKRNSNFDIFSNLTTQIKGNITHLGIQAPSDTKFYLNGEDFLVPSTGLYELQGEFRVTSLRFDREYISKEKAKTIIIDLIYEGNEVDNTGTAEAAANSAWTAATLAQQILDNITKYPGGGSGVGVQSIEQTTTSTEDGGENIITVTLTDGTISTFSVWNGSQGSPGTNGDTPVRGEDYWTDDDIATIKGYVDEAILGGAW